MTRDGPRWQALIRLKEAVIGIGADTQRAGADAW